MERRVLVQGMMSPRLIIVGSIRAYDSTQMRFTEYDHVIQAVYTENLSRHGLPITKILIVVQWQL
jgi:hypothetical protein